MSTNTKSTPLEALKDQTILIFEDMHFIRGHWVQYAKDHDYQTVYAFSSWEEFVAQNAFSLAENAVAFVDIRYHGSRYNGVDIAGRLRELGIRKMYAITADPEFARASGLFDDVFGKEVPAQFERLLG